jgi:DNA polymerase-2
VSSGTGPQTECFLLNHGGYDRDGHYEIRLHAATRQGVPAKIIITNFRPLFFVSRDTPRTLTAAVVERKVLPLTAMDGAAVDCCYFRTQAAMEEARRKVRLAGWRTYESDVHSVERYLMERSVKGGFLVTGEPTRSDASGLTFQDPHIRGASVDIALTVLSLDIETDVDADRVISIACLGKQSVVFIIGEGPDDAGLNFCRDEAYLLRRFLTHINAEDPDILIGWNVIQFDLMFLQKRCADLGIAFEIGRDAVGRILPPTSPGRPATARVPGRAVLDLPAVLRGQFAGFEDYSLDAVAAHVLGERKLVTLQGREKIDEIIRLFHEDKPALARYNLHDAVLTRKIFDKKNILANGIERSRLSGHILDRGGGSIAAFDFLYLPLLHRRGYVALDVADIKPSAAPLTGGYVIEPKPGIYENVLVLDFRSLYPTIIRTFCIDPLGRVALTPPLIAGPSGIAFSRETNILPHIIADLLEARGQARKTHNAPLSQAIKNLMNGFYGVLGAPVSRFFNPELAEAITATGRYTLMRTIGRIEETTPHVVLYGDTDSLFVVLGPGLESQAQSIGNDLAASITAWLAQSLAAEFGVQSALELKFETHFRHFFMPAIRGSTQGSKKRYCGAIENDGGLELVFKGMESARSDWTPLAKEFQHELFMRLFTKEPLEAFILDTVAAVRAGQCDHKLVYRKGVRKSLDEYTDHIPQHVQAARLLGADTHRIAYVMTKIGPQPVGMVTSPLSYEHYISAQLKPIAETILERIGLDFEAIVAGQTNLF